MSNNRLNIKVGAMTLAIVGVFFAVGNMLSPHWRSSISAYVGIAFGLFCLFVGVRAYLRACYR